MKKDRIRDYATAAFRDYAIQRKNKNFASDSLRADFEAVQKTLKFFCIEGELYIIAAVEAVYFAEAGLPVRRSSISARVSRFAIEQHADESTVYRWLKKARCKFAEYRGLTL